VLFHREKQYLVDKKVKGLEFTPIGGEYYFGNLSLK
jgi:extracellular solute-binding protein family 5